MTLWERGWCCHCKLFHHSAGIDSDVWLTPCTRRSLFGSYIIQDTATERHCKDLHPSLRRTNTCIEYWSKEKPREHYILCYFTSGNSNHTNLKTTRRDRCIQVSVKANATLCSTTTYAQTDSPDSRTVQYCFAPLLIQVRRYMLTKHCHVVTGGCGRCRYRQVSWRRRRMDRHCEELGQQHHRQGFVRTARGAWLPRRNS